MRFSDPDGLRPGDPFKTSKEAGVDVIKYINPSSIRDAHEYAGLIYQVGRKYFATTPVRGGHADSQTLNDMAEAQVRGSLGIPVGDYHTHGDYGYVTADNDFVRTSKEGSAFDDDCFSRRDKILSESRFAASHRAGQDGWESFLGTPSGTIRQYDPLTGIDAVIK
jgi:hypothetical protein